MFLVLAGLAWFFFLPKQTEINGTNDLNMTNEINKPELKISSPAFENGQPMPAKYTCDGENINPPLSIKGVPKGAQSLALVMDDPDAIKPAGKIWDHWVVWNMPETATEIAEGEEPEGVHGRGTRGGLEYQGPCPPDARHTYFFKLYALDAKLSLKEGATKLDLEQAMAGHILSQSELTGTYERKR